MEMIISNSIRKHGTGLVLRPHCSVSKISHLSTSTSDQAQACSARFPPNSEYLSQATTVKHIHFKGLTDYETGSEIQNHILDQHVRFKLANKTSRAIFQAYPTILTFEFSSIYTGGKRERDSKKATTIPLALSKSAQNDGHRMTSLGVPYIQTDRGGQVTYHGPGQLVAYFLWDLKLWKNLSSRCFVNFIEQCSMNAISKTGVPNTCKTENTGVWIHKKGGDLEKISSIGLNIKRNVTSHGLSINLSPDLEFLNNPEFVMCGLRGFRQTSIEKELAELPLSLNVENLADILCDCIKSRMDSYMMNLPGTSDHHLLLEKKTMDLRDSSLSEAFILIDQVVHV